MSWVENKTLVSGAKKILTNVFYSQKMRVIGVGDVASTKIYGMQCQAKYSVPRS